VGIIKVNDINKKCTAIYKNSSYKSEHANEITFLQQDKKVGSKIKYSSTWKVVGYD